MAIKQEHRRCKVTSPLGEDALILTSLEASEQISEPFQIDCRFASENNEIDFKKIIGEKVTLELEMAGGEKRYFNGRVARFAQSDAEATNIVYSARIVPWFWFLRHRTDSRIFQRETVLQILEKVFQGHKDIADFKPDIEGSYDPIPYCVQYQESDFNFASRLMEEWGISYYFEHAKDGHKLVMFNANSKVKPCPGQKKAAYVGAEADDKTPGQVVEWKVQQEFRSGAYGATDFNPRDPGVDLGIEKKTKNPLGGNDKYQIFAYPGEYQSLGEGDKRTELRMQAEECAVNAIQGAGSCYGFAPGYKFDLTGHHRGTFNDTYIITSVFHVLTQSLGSQGVEETRYDNSFSCRPHGVPFRPLCTTPKPVVQGLQTAIVVGEAGKEIDLDDLGCIYVQFHWDRNAKSDPSSSCRVRVARAWAGKEWGAYFAPRIGQEVIIEYEEGDINRPMATGSLHNGAQKPPFGSGNESGIKTRSTMKGGAGNYNELRFDDTKGSELFSMQAEKDMKTLVKHNRTDNVHAAQVTTIGGTKKTTVGSDHSEEIGGIMTLTVKQAKNELVYLASSEEVGLARNLSVGGAYTIEVVGGMNEGVLGAKATEIGLAHAEVVGRNRTMKVGKKFSLEAGEDIEMKTDKKFAAEATEDFGIKTAKKFTLEATDEIEIKTGSASLVMKSDGKIVLKGTDVTMEGGSGKKVNIDGGGIITIDGTMVKINA